MVFMRWNQGVFNQYMAAISGSLCYSMIGAATAWPSPVLIEMEDHETPLILNVTQISWMVSLMFLGHVLSPIPTGYLMEMFGRKRTCLACAIFPFSSWLLILFGRTVAELYIARFAAGLWIGISSTIMPIYVGEIASTDTRSSLTTINNLLFNFGILFSYVIGPYVSYNNLAIACEILTLLYIFSFSMMPETPHHFVKHNQRENALKALRWLRESNSKESIENELQEIEQAIADQNLQTGSLKDIICDKGNRKALTISIVYAVLKRLSGSNVMQAYMSVTLPQVTMRVLDPDTCVIIVGTISLISSITVTGLALRFRRTILMTISSAGCAVTTGIVAMWFYLNRFTTIDVSKYSDIVFWSMFIYYIVFNVGLGPIGTSIKGEIFSANVKGLSSSLTTFCVAISAFLMNKYYLVIASAYGMYVNYLLYSVSCVVAIVFTLSYVPEMHKKSPLEIREMLMGRSKNQINGQP